MRVSLCLLLALHASLAPASASSESINFWLKEAANSPYLAFSLHEAARLGKTKALKECLAQGHNPNQVDEQGSRPLHLAVAAGKPACVKLLLLAGADALAKDGRGRIASACGSDEQSVKMCKVMERRRAKELRIIASIQRGDTQALKEYLEAKGNPNARDDKGQHTLLGFALLHGKVAAAKLLLAAGAKAEQNAPHGKNLLMLATSHNDAELIETLIKKGAKPLHQSHNGATALHDAVWGKKLTSVRALLPYYKEQNFNPDGRGNGLPIEMAIDRNATQIVLAFVNAGLKPNDARFKTPLLILATQKGNREMVQALLKAGADPKARDKQGKTAADYAKGDITPLLKK